MAARDVDAPQASPGTDGPPPAWPDRLDEPAPAADPATGPPTLAVPGLAGTGDPRRAYGGGPPSPPPAARLRYRVLPRSLLGITAMILSFSIGAGLVGTALYAYFEYQEQQTDQKVDALVDGYKHQFERAEADLRAATAAGRAQIEAAAGAGSQAATDPTAQQAMVRALSPSLYFVTTQGAAGQASVGTAFVVASNTAESFLLTSYTTVAAATVVPGPKVTVRPAKGGAAQTVTVQTWDPAHDLALIVLPVGNLPVVKPAPTTPGPQLGQTVFAVSALGSEGGAIATGEVDDVSTSGVAVDIPIGPAFQGGPIVDTQGEVIAVASRTYSPLGFVSEGIWYAPFVDAACHRVLNCPGGTLSSSG